MKKQLAYLIEVAMPAINALPLRQRADAYMGISAAWSNHNQELSQRAADAADAMHEAEARQLTFAAMLEKSTTEGGAA